VKFVARVIGIAVLILVLAYFGLMYLNDRGFITGNFSAFLTKLSINVQNIGDDTQEFLTDEGIWPTAAPTPQAE